MSNDTITDKAFQEKLEMARAANPGRRLYPCDSPAGLLILGAPKPEGFMAYQTLRLSDEPGEKAKAANVLLIACAVDPDPETMAKVVLRDYVALALSQSVADAVSLCIGTTKADTEKK